MKLDYNNITEILRMAKVVLSNISASSIFIKEEALILSKRLDAINIQNIDDLPENKTSELIEACQLINNLYTKIIN